MTRGVDRARLDIAGQKRTRGDVGLDAVRLDKTNFAEIAAGLPAQARMVLSAMMALPHGLLQVRIPDGRKLIVGGNAPGPEAELVLHNWKLPGRAFSGGSIGLAESYMDGDWESPDVTSFLEPPP